MYNPAAQLPQKNVNGPSAQEEPPSQASRSKKGAADPLGIIVDASVSKSGATLPKQTLTLNSDEPKLASDPRPGLSRKKSSIPKSLDLRPIYGQAQSQTKIRSPEAITPIIIITPTDDSVPTQHATEAPPVRRPRVVSSVYSPQYQHGPSGRAVRRTSSMINDAYDKFAPLSARGGSFKTRDMSRRFSLATALPTPKGWWTVITSPFNNSNIFAPQESPLESESSDSGATPLLDSAAPVGLSSSRTADVNETPTAEPSALDVEDSPFRHFIPPTTGEAAKFYDPNNDFSTPRLLSAGFYSPPPPMSARTVESMPEERESEDREGPILLSRQNPEVQDSAKRVPEPQGPKLTPPKSCVAAFVQDFSSHEAPRPVTKVIDTAIANREPLSPLSPSPIVETASLATIQIARSVDTEQPKPVRARPALRVITNNNGAPAQENKAPAVPCLPSPEPAAETPSANASPLIDRDERARDMGESMQAPPVDTRATDVASMGPNPQDVARPTDENMLKLNVVLQNTPPARAEYVAPMSVHDSWSTRGDPEKFELDSVLEGEKPTRKKKRWQCPRLERLFLIGMGVLLAIMVMLAVVLCVTLTKQTSSMPVQQHWLNLTGFPPLPTGISTVTRLSTVDSISGCVNPPEMWSCALPKERRPPGSTGEPQFRLSILFNNGSISDSSLTQPVVQRRSISTPTFDVRSTLKRYLLRKRDDPPAAMLDAYPSPPSDMDSQFLGNTTDNVSRPYIGEETPFVISFLPTVVQPPAKRSKRSADTSTTLLNAIPSPTLGSDGRAPPPELHPYPQAQPLRLFDRGQATEHYGFYTYFDKSIFLASASDSSGASFLTLNSNGGARIHDADARCVWSQTRFLAQIWTMRGSPSAPPTPNSVAKHVHVLHGPNGTTSAFNFSGSGTFPWPVTITLDRHGGDASAKGLYCYGVDADAHIVSQQKAVHAEDRGFAGRLVNPAPGPFADIELSTGDGGWGGVDGGTGGCSCQWANFDSA